MIAVADSDPERAALEARLDQGAPEGVTLDLDISAPRPVIAPFAFDASLTDGVLTLAACSADSDETAARIGAAAKAAGLAGDAAAAVRGADVVVTIVSDGDAVASLVEPALGAMDGAVWAQMSTVGVTALERLVAMAADAGVALVDAPHNAAPLAAVLAPQIASLAGGFTHVLGPSSTFGKDLLPRVAALLGVGQISDVLAVVGPPPGLREQLRGRFVLAVVAGDAAASVEVAGEHAGAEPELAGVGDADRVGLIFRGDDRRDRAEHLLVVRGLAGGDVGQHGRGVPGAGAVGDLAAEQQAGAAGDDVHVTVGQQVERSGIDG